MDKSYSVNGVVYNFTNVHEECGALVGECTTRPYCGQLAWLDTAGVQFFGEHRVEATAICTVSQSYDNSYTMWGGQLRDKLPHGARYYERR